MFDSDVPSLFDPENLRALAMLQQQLSSPSASAAVMAQHQQPVERSASVSTVDQIFAKFQIDEMPKDWHAGVLDVDIIHRGRIRLRASEWPPAIAYCKTNSIENGIVKQFRLHVLCHSPGISLVYGTYRFRPQISKEWLKDYRCGKLLDPTMNVRETMVNLAYRLTAHEHAEKNYPTWEQLIEEATTKLVAAAHSNLTSNLE